MKKFLPFIILIIFALNSHGCKKAEAETRREQYTNLNVTILLDLSDRISKTKNPEQLSRDTSAVMQIVHSFKKFIRSKGIVHTDDKIKLLFYPQGNQELIHNTAAELSVDFASLEGENKRPVYEQLDSVYSAGLAKIYDAASSAGEYKGSDLYSFFRYRAEDDCINEQKGYKNILVILTDGYLYHKDNMMKQGNRYSYIGPEAQHLKIFRGEQNWEAVYEKGDYGFIPAGVELSELSVLVLEVNPAHGHVRDYEVLRKYWSGWFEEMGISRYKIVQTDMPVQNSPLIAKFIDGASRNQ
ncbi:MAG: hypothetical protein AMXMBFR48_30270 [Ignavibacteriales bacterium]